jgi:diguanylate cyclase (GGDEF)-like protein
LSYWVEKELATERLGLAQRDLIQQLNNAERKALLDPLTRLWNRNGITRVLEKQVKFSKNAAKTFAVAILDIDFFKKINDTYGHPAGDKVLAEVSRRIRSASRDSDAVGRLGGEEFIIVMPDVDTKLANDICARILERFRQHYFDVGTGRIPVRASIGCCLCGKEGGWDEEEAIKNADKALYLAKANGRDQFVMG